MCVVLDTLCGEHARIAVAQLSMNQCTFSTARIDVCPSVIINQSVVYLCRCTPFSVIISLLHQQFCMLNVALNIKQTNC